MKNNSINDSFKRAFGNLKKDSVAATRQMQTGEIRHVSGLSVPQGVSCVLAVTEAELGIRAAGQNFRVPMERIFSVGESTDTETRQHIGSSLSQTLLGGLAFGDTGAIIGAMPQSKYKKAVSRYNLVVSYRSEAGEVKSLIFSADKSLQMWVREIDRYKEGAPPAGQDGAITL